MPSRSIQISIDEGLLSRVDKQPLAKKRGRSAFIRVALEAYLEEEHQRAIDNEYARAYGGGSAKVVAEEFRPLMGRQRWPEE